MIPFLKKEFKFLPSTNLYLKKHYKKTSDFTVIVAEKQKNGYGRKSRIWYSPEGGLWFSFIVSTSNPFFWIMCSSVSIIDIFPELKIKWPNDVYYKKRKVAGILSEKIENKIIVGIGINVNNSVPKELEQKATSLNTIYSKTFDLKNLLNNILEKIYDNNKNPGNVFSKWKSYSAILGKKIKIKRNDTLIEGIVKDLSEDGGIIFTDSIRNRKITYGDIIDW